MLNVVLGVYRELLMKYIYESATSIKSSHSTHDIYGVNIAYNLLM